MTWTTGHRALRGAIVAVLAAAAAFGAAGAAQAADQPQGTAANATVGQGSIAWGYKESFRRYVGAQTAAMPPIGALPEGQRITVHDGASFDANGTPAIPGATSNPNETLPYLFPTGGGSYTDAANFTVDASGKVAYHFPSHAFEATISNVSLVVAGGVASLVGDMVVDVTENAFGYTPGHFGGPDVVIATVDKVSATPAADGTSLSVTATGLKATETAAQAMAGFLAAGDPLDDLRLQVALTTAPPAPAGTDIPIDVVIPQTVPEPEPGVLTMTVEGPTTVSLGTATADAANFTSTGALRPVTVKDTRDGAPGWSVNGKVSAFSSSGATFAGSRLGWTPKVTTAGAGAVAGAAVTAGAASNAGLATGATLASAPSGHELGSAVVGADLTLAVPLDTPAGSYSATLTLTLLG